MTPGELSELNVYVNVLFERKYVLINVHVNVLLNVNMFVKTFLSVVNVLVNVNTFMTFERGVRHGASRRTRFRNPLDFTWISDFRLDFWISRGFLDFKVDFWISRGFLDFKVDFWISRGFSDFKVDFYILDFVWRAIICYSEDTAHKQAFSARMHAEYNVTDTSQFTATALRPRA